MQLKSLGLAALMFLAALFIGGCTGNQPSDDTVDTADTDTETPLERVDVKVTAATPYGFVQCDVNVDNAEIVESTNKVFEVAQGEHIFTVGSFTAGETEDGLPIHVDTNGEWVSPAATMTIIYPTREPVEVKFTMNRYISGEWTCQNQTVAVDHGTFEVEYLNGNTIPYLYGMGEVTVSGNTISGGDTTVTWNGELTSQTTLGATVEYYNDEHVVIESYTYDCWAGEMNDRPS